ncbi:UNVERIFIED_CONTAM: hypothetical protein Sindi_2275400 [Sesamum indicum]
MNSKQQLLDSLTAHISLYHSQIPEPHRTPNSGTRPALLRWFSSLSVHQRRSHLTMIDANFVAILLQMKQKLQSHGSGRFIILPDLPQDGDSALPTLCYRKSEGLLSRFSEFNCAERAIHEAVELFSSTEGERDGKGNEVLGLDAVCLAEGLVGDVSRFVEIMDEITNGEFLRGGDEGEIAEEWVELGWLKAKGYYSLEEFVVNRMEVALRLAWLNSNTGKKRGVKLKERLNAAGVAANLFWRKKGCVDWWEKLDDSVKKKVYSAYLGKAARSLPDVTFPLQPPEPQNSTTRKASLQLIHDILHDEIDSFCKQEPIKEAGILEGRNGIKETCLQIPIIMLVVEVPLALISTTMSNVQTPKEEADQVASEDGNPFQTDAASLEGTTSPKWSKIRNGANDGFKSVRLDISFKSPTHTGLQTTGLILLITRFLQHEHHHGRPINQVMCLTVDHRLVINLATGLDKEELWKPSDGFSIFLWAFADAYAMLENELTCLHNEENPDVQPTCQLLPKLIPSIGHLFVVSSIGRRRSGIFRSEELVVLFAIATDPL